MDYLFYKMIILCLLILSSIFCFYLETKRGTDDLRMSFGFVLLFVFYSILM